MVLEFVSNKLNLIFYKPVIYLITAFILCINGIGAANASSIRQIHMDEMLKTAELIFEGKVIKSEARWLANGITIKTFIVFEVEEVISGEYSDSQLTLSFEGGTVAEDTVQISDLNMPELGEKGIYFIEQLDRSSINPIVGWSQGHFLLKPNSSGEQTVLTQSGMFVTNMAQQLPNIEKRTVEINTNGIASGVTASKTNADTVMTAKDFKQTLRLRLQELK